jgi:hypothetical protein
VRCPNAVAARMALGLTTAALLGGCTAGAMPSPSDSPTLRLASPAVWSSPSPVATPSQSPSSLATAEPIATPLPTLSAEPQWERVPDQKAFADSSMVAVAAGPDGYVAVGTAWLAEDQDVGMTWTSSDGVAWRRASVPLTGGIPTGMIRDRAGYLAWGWWLGRAVVWTSPDGEAWRRSADLPDSRDAWVTGVARLGDYLVGAGYAEIASGNDFVHEFRTWTSPDGLAWTSVNPVTSIPWDGYVYGVTAADDALVAWGYARVGDEYPPVTLRSTDGRHWEIGEVTPGVEGYMREGIMEITGAGGRLVAVGHGLGGEEGSPPPPSAAWTSADGLTWKPAVFEPEPATGWLLQVVRSGDEYDALGGSGVDSVVWRSADGTTWTQSRSSPDAGRDGEAEGCAGGRCPNTVANDLAAGPAGLVAVGRSTTATGGRTAVVWIAPAD